MDVTGAIKARRSIRKFKRKEIPAELLDHILEMARTAPSGANRQPWEMVVVTDRQRLKGLVPICKDQGFVGDCSAFLIGIDDPQQKWAKVDLTIALDHIALVAVEEGLGTCWIGWFDERALKRALGLPRRARVDILIALGYPADEPPEGGAKRRPLEEIRRYLQTPRAEEGR